MLKSFKSFKSLKGDSNVSFQILCKITAIVLYRCEENIKKLLNHSYWFLSNSSTKASKAG